MARLDDMQSENFENIQVHQTMLCGDDSGELLNSVFDNICDISPEKSNTLAQSGNGFSEYEPLNQNFNQTVFAQNQLAS